MILARGAGLWIEILMIVVGRMMERRVEGQVSKHEKKSCGHNLCVIPVFRQGSPGNPSEMRKKKKKNMIYMKTSQCQATNSIPFLFFFYL